MNLTVSYEDIMFLFGKEMWRTGEIEILGNNQVIILTVRYNTDQYLFLKWRTNSRFPSPDCTDTHLTLPYFSTVSRRSQHCDFTKHSDRIYRSDQQVGMVDF